jgi:hypothetical protein
MHTKTKNALQMTVDELEIMQQIEMNWLVVGKRKTNKENKKNKGGAIQITFL